MKTYITSDLHFSHKAITRYCPVTRPYSDILEMNADMIEKWNNVVEPEDLTYILGDVVFCTGAKGADIINQLNGRKILIIGNHDEAQMESSVFIDCFESIHNILEIKYNDVKIVMCHYPIFDHKNCARGALMLHGHRHGDPTDIPGRIKDVGFDATGKIVSLLDDVVEELILIEPMRHH